VDSEFSINSKLNEKGNLEVLKTPGKFAHKIFEEIMAYPRLRCVIHV
jgi:hypothetical protein